MQTVDITNYEVNLNLNNNSSISNDGGWENKKRHKKKDNNVTGNLEFYMLIGFFG